MAAHDLLRNLEADGILTVVDVDDIDQAAALYVLEDAVDRLLDLLRPALAVDDRNIPAVLDVPALRGAAHLLAAALLVHQTAADR